MEASAMSSPRKQTNTLGAVGIFVELVAAIFSFGCSRYQCNDRCAERAWHHFTNKKRFCLQGKFQKGMREKNSSSACLRGKEMVKSNDGR